jgi:hypothetical protein
MGRIDALNAMVTSSFRALHCAHAYCSMPMSQQVESNTRPSSAMTHHHQKRAQDITGIALAKSQRLRPAPAQGQVPRGQHPRQAGRGLARPGGGLVPRERGVVGAGHTARPGGRRCDSARPCLPQACGVALAWGTRSPSASPSPGSSQTCNDPAPSRTDRRAALGADGSRRLLWRQRPRPHSPAPRTSHCAGRPPDRADGRRRRRQDHGRAKTAARLRQQRALVCVAFGDAARHR